MHHFYADHGTEGTRTAISLQQPTSSNHETVGISTKHFSNLATIPYGTPSKGNCRSRIFLYRFDGV